MICIKINRNKIKKLLDKGPLKIYGLDKENVVLVFKELPKLNIKYELIECEKILHRKKEGLKLRDLVPNLRSFYIIGDIALVSPKSDINPERVAEAIMKINKNVNAVYIRRKVSGQLRINELIYAGGEKRTKTIYKENGLRFSVDISKVYVNPSLSNERLKISLQTISGIKILDAFTGYGAIALTIASRNSSYIVAGDLNIDGLYLLLESLNLNLKILKGVIDVVQYDAKFLPFRDDSFDLTIADNPTAIVMFKPEICRVSKEVIFYILSHSEDEASRLLGESVWEKVNEYSKDLFIFKGRIRC